MNKAEELIYKVRELKKKDELIWLVENKADLSEEREISSEEGGRRRENSA